MIYLDHHATTPLCAQSRDAMLAALEITGANASSVHAAGRRARALIEDARAALASAVGALAREIVFTSGGTEALHLGVRGVGRANTVASVLVDPGAHPALRRAAETLALEMGISVVDLTPGPDGAIDVGAVERAVALAPAPALLAVAVVQHETGVQNDLATVQRIARAHGAFLVLDAVQALGKIPLDLAATGAHAAALSAHKIGGPCGVGALWLRADTRATAVITGGGQERGLRAGTENSVGISGFGGAARALTDRLAARARVAGMRARIEASLRAVDGIVINGERGTRVSGACHASVRGVAGEELVAALDLAGYCVSSGPACSSGRAGPSASMLAMFPDEPWRASSALRITLGPENNDDEISSFVAAFPAILARVRAF